MERPEDEPERSGFEFESEHVEEAEEGVRRRDVFDNIEFRQLLNVSPPQDPDFASFYRNVVEEFQRAVERAATLAGPRDLVQVELRGESLQSSVSMIRRDGAESLDQFQTLLDKLVQSNVELPTDQTLEVVVQIVRNPAGGMGQKRKLKTLMESEILKKKGRFLYVVNNAETQTCFSINVALLLEPSLTDAQASLRGAELHRRAGLSDDAPVTLEDVSKFEQMLSCRIVVFYRRRGDRTLLKFLTEQSRAERTLLMLLHEGHYYGIKDLKGFLGNNFACEATPAPTVVPSAATPTVRRSLESKRTVQTATEAVAHFTASKSTASQKSNRDLVRRPAGVTR